VCASRRWADAAVLLSEIAAPPPSAKSPKDRHDCRSFSRTVRRTDPAAWATCYRSADTSRGFDRLVHQARSHTTRRVILMVPIVFDRLGPRPRPAKPPKPQPPKPPAPPPPMVEEALALIERPPPTTPEEREMNELIRRTLEDSKRLQRGRGWNRSKPEPAPVAYPPRPPFHHAPTISRRRNSRHFLLARPAAVTCYRLRESAHRWRSLRR
jgi:hypothetical protein